MHFIQVYIQSNASSHVIRLSFVEECSYHLSRIFSLIASLLTFRLLCFDLQVDFLFRAICWQESHVLLGCLALVVLAVKLFTLLYHYTSALVALSAYSSKALYAVSLAWERLGYYQRNPCSRSAIVVASHSCHWCCHQHWKHLLIIFQCV